MTRPVLACLITSLALTGCAPTLSLAPKGALATEAGVIVTLQHDWTRWPDEMNTLTPGSVLTRDGLALNRLHVLSLRDGETMVRTARRRDNPPSFHTGMTGDELARLMADSLSWMGWTQVSTTRVRPQPLDRLQGVRMDVSGQYLSGLNMAGDAMLAEDNGVLHVVVFLAPATVYFDRDADEVDAIIRSARPAPR